ncbi:hypothetical protein PHYBOEH_000321 [Phytophthora boehmeriae]|uniref:Uncharacterized protein n=1 Tax=Phytophthora boehmeriae TaxID=109152 RepID=A0A8T1WWZ7_9STRA|nr:hypothetical protein PHYBOEH_000321 [Phytophthora boehmeriae]
MTDTSQAAAHRQRSIWSKRVHRELDKCRVSGVLPRGATLRRAHVSETRGMCEGEFHCFVPFVEGSDALSLVPLTDLVIRMPFSSGQLAEGEAQYPFLAPEVHIRRGAIYLPPEMRERRPPEHEGDEPNFMLKLPILSNWSPSTTLKMVIHEFFKVVQESDPGPKVKTPTKKFAKETSTSKSEWKQAQNNGKRPMRMRKRDVRGAVYPCQEVDPTTSTLKQTPMLLQSGNIALLMPSKEAKKAGAGGEEDCVYVGDLIALKDVVRITPQRGKSLTLFFKDRSLPCRTFLSQYTDEIVKDLRVMIGETSGNKRGREQSGTAAGGANGAGSAAQLMPFLSSEQTEKAKEMSTKFIGRLGKVVTSVSRFWRGDEDEPMHDRPRTTSDPLAATFADIDMQKEAFYRTPSKARMTEITRRYQHLAEEYAYLNNQEGHVERAISELQIFIEHPKAQRILLETVAYEQSTKGIRVGPA